MARPASDQRLTLDELHDGSRIVVEADCYGFEANTVVEVEATPDGLGFCTADAHGREHHADRVNIRWTLLADIVDEDGFLRGVRRHVPISPAPLAAPVGKRQEPQALRWKVTLIYRSECGPVDVTHEVEELSEIEDLVERGPDWNTLIRGSFVLNPARTTAPGKTLEA